MRGQSKEELTAVLFVEQLLNELVCFLDYIDHEGLDLLVIESRQLGPGNFPEGGRYQYIGLISSLGIGRDTCVQVLENGIAKAPMHEVLCESFLQNWVHDENPHGIVSFIHVYLHEADPL